VWVSSDVFGPAEPQRPVRLTLCRTDGSNPPQVRGDLATLDAGECATYVGALSTRARLNQFAHDFGEHACPGYGFAPVTDEDPEAPTSTVVCTLATAMEFLTRKDYTDNWVSECHERFTDMNLSSWTALLTRIGFELDPATHAWRNDWIVEHRFDPVASLADEQGRALAWPATHVLVVARRPAVALGA